MRRVVRCWLALALIGALCAGAEADIRGEPEAAKETRVDTMEGGCHCGEMRYEARGPVVKCSFCDCAGCRRATGTLKAPFVTVPREGFRMTAGKPREFRAENGVKCDAHGAWHFCPDCGTQLFWLGNQGTELDIFAGTLDDTCVFRPEPQTEAQAASGEEGDPEIRTMDLKLVGVQAVIDHDQDFGDDLWALWAKLCARLDEIPNVSESRRAVGYWQFIDDSTRVYFAGVQVDTLEGFDWDHGYGLGSWTPGETKVAIFREKNGEEGSVVPRAFQTLSEMGYGFDSRFLGEFEVFPLAWQRAGERPAEEFHEVWIPVVKEAE